jgi:type II secretory pathway pseudopilin PulG
MSDEVEVKEPMSHTMKIVIAIAGVFIAGFLLVGQSKQKTTAEIEAESMIRNYANIQGMANQKCPAAVEDATGEKVFFPSKTESDKDTYITLFWEGENTATGGFKNASCTLKASLGGISELVVDDKVIIKK